MTRTLRLIVVLGAVALTGLAGPSTANAQRRPPSGAVSRGSSHVAGPRKPPPYGHSNSYYRPYYQSYYRPYYYRPYSSYYSSYYSPFYFSFGFGFGSYAPYY